MSIVFATHADIGALYQVAGDCDSVCVQEGDIIFCVGKGLKGYGVRFLTRRGFVTTRLFLALHKL